MEKLIEISHLNKSFGELRAVDDISLHVSAGEIYGLVGPDGAGKTTTLRLLCGAYLPTVEGGESPPTVRVAGYDMLTQTDQARSQIGYLPQRFSLYEELSVIENLRFFAEVRGLSARDWRPRSLEILDFVGLGQFLDRRAGHLSGGMRQKLGLAAALVHQPRVLLLDEPTTGVDPVTRQDFWQLIIRLVGARESDAPGDGTAVLVSTPYMDEASRCTRLGFMSLGRLVLEGTPAELRANLAGRVLELAGEPLPLLRKLAQSQAEVEDVQMFGDRMHLRVREGGGEGVMERLREEVPRQGGQITRLRAVEPGLEDKFMELVQGAFTDREGRSAGDTDEVIEEAG